MLVWVLTDSKAGNQKQALALAESVSKKTSAKYEHKIITPKSYLKHLPNGIIPKHIFACEEKLPEPYPKLIISCGRITAHTALAIKQASPETKIVQILHPTARTKEYDLLILPKHDRRHVDNACIISGALSDITPKLAAAKKAFAPQYGNLQKPILGVLIGGNNKAYKFDSKTINSISDFLHAWVKQGYNIIGTFSRRTPEALQDKLLSMNASIPQVNFWNGEGENPYQGILAYADAFAVTCDSINMVSEAFHTGKPTYIIPLTQKRKGINKFSRFHDYQILAKRIRPASENLSLSWKPRACDDLPRATDAVCKLF